MNFKIDDFDIEQITNDKSSAKDGEQFLKETLKEINKQDLFEDMLLRISELTKSHYIYKISMDGQAVGEITFGENERKPVIGIEIEEQFRNRGIGYKVLKCLLARDSAHGDVEYFVYSVRNDNIPSIRLVEKLGGVRVKTFKIFENHDLEIYTYHIPPNKVNSNAIIK